MGEGHLLIYLWSMARAWELEYLEYHCMHFCSGAWKKIEVTA